MRSNFHYQSSSDNKPSAASLSLMQELRRTQEEIQMNKRRLQQIQETNQRYYSEYNPPNNREQQKLNQPSNQLRQQFYEMPPKSRQGINRNQRDFFSRFSNNNDEQVKKEMYRNQLNRQIEHKRQESVQKQRREQLADDVWLNVLKGRPGNSGDDRSRSPGIREDRSRAVEMVNESRNSREEQVRYTRPARIAEPIGLSEEEQRQQRIKEEKKRLYYEQLNKQIEEQKRRKEQQKKLVKAIKIEARESKFTGGVSKSQQKPYNKLSEIAQVQAQAPVPQTKQNAQGFKDDQDEQQKILKKKYTKGLIDIEEYEKLLRLIKMKYGRNEQNNEKKRIQTLVVDQSNQFIKQHKPQPIKKTQAQYARADGNQSFNHNYNMGTSRHLYSESLIQQPTQYYPIYQTPELQPQEQSPQKLIYHSYPSPPIQQANLAPSMDPYQYANILQQNQLEMFQKMMQGMKDIIATTLMYDRKKIEETPKQEFRESRQRPYLNTIETEQYRSIPRQIPHRQIRSPQLTKINSPSPRHYMEPSISLQNIKLACESIDDSKNFFRKPHKIKPFKKFDYVEKMGGSTLEIPSTSCSVTSGDGFQTLQRSFEKDLIMLKQLQLSQQIQNIKQDKPYFKKKVQPVEMETGTFKGLGVEKKSYKQISKQQIKEEPEQFNFYQPEPIKPKKWKQQNRDDNKINQHQKQLQRPTSRKQIEHKSQKQIKQNNLQNQFLQGISGFPTFVVDDISELRRQLKKQEEESQNPAILQRSTYEVKKPIVIVNSSEKKQSYQKEPEQFKFSVPKPREIYEVEEIGIESKSELQEFLRPHHSSSSKNLKRPSYNVSAAQDSINAESHFETSAQKLNSNVMKLSRNKINEMKKSKDGILLDFMALSSPYKRDEVNVPYNHYTYEQEITEKIQQPSYQRPKLAFPSYTKYKSLDVDQHVQSQTILSKYENSSLKDLSQLNYSRQLSSLTSLQQARKKAKEGRNREKKQSSLLTINTLEQLERQIKKKEIQPQEEIPIKKVKPAPALLKNPKQLLGMLDQMVDGEDEEYPNEFDSYHEN